MQLYDDYADIGQIQILPAWVSALSPGTWHEIPNTNLSSVNPSRTLLAGESGSGLLAKVETWTSMVVDPATSKVYSVAAGGHTDYAGNEVDALSLNQSAPAWAEILAPTPNVSIVASADFYSDGRPTSRHHYYGLTYNKPDNRFMLFGGSRYGDGGQVTRIASFQISNGTYNASTTHNDVTASWTSGLGTLAANPDTGDVYGAAGFTASKWIQSTNTFSDMSGYTGSSPYGYYTMSAFDTLRGRVLYLGGLNAEHITYTVGTDTFASIFLSGANAANVSALEQGAMVYIPALDVYLVRDSFTGGTVYQVNASTFEVTTFSTTGGASVPVTVNGPFNKFLLVPVLKGCAYVPSHTGNVWFLRTH